MPDDGLVSRTLLVVGPDSAGQRLDLYLSSHLLTEGQSLSRSRLKQLIEDGLVLVNDLPQKAGYPVRPGDRLLVRVPVPVASSLDPQPLAFDVLLEDDDILVLIKPPDTVVHPAAGHRGITLVHGLLHHCDSLSGINGELRPGIVHRLDKDTSGLMVVAKTDLAHRQLSEQFKNRRVEKIYLALLDSRPAATSGRIDLPIGRHPVHRKKMSVRQDGREARTNWRLLEGFASGLALVELRLETGRTHQIRVHMAALGHPVAGDAVYGRKNPIYQELAIVRQCLHAHRLAFDHPRSGEALHFTAPLWPDIQTALDRLRAASESFCAGKSG